MSDGAWFGVYSGDTRRYSIDLRRLDDISLVFTDGYLGDWISWGVVWTEDLMTSINVIKVVIVVGNIKIVRAIWIA